MSSFNHWANVRARTGWMGTPSRDRLIDEPLAQIFRHEPVLVTASTSGPLLMPTSDARVHFAHRARQLLPVSSVGDRQREMVEAFLSTRMAIACGYAIWRSGLTGGDA